MDNIRVLHLVSSLSRSSGVISVIMNYYRHIDKEKIQFDFLFFEDEENAYKNEIEAMGGHVYLIAKPSLSRSFKHELKGFFREHKDKHTVLHIHEVYLTFLFSPIAKKYGIRNIITHSHTTMYSDKKLSAIRNRLLCVRLKKHANHYFACSKVAGEFLYGKKCLNEGKARVINNAINCAKFKYDPNARQRLRSELNLEDKLVIGHIGRFNEQKNHMFLIDIFKALKKQKKNVMLVLVGEGPLLEQTKEKVMGLGLNEDVLFLGKRNDIPNLLHIMDMFLLPSLFEGLPVVGVEAQASGVPIIMSTNITREIGLIKSHYIPLNQPAKYWAEYILSIPIDTNRENADQKLRRNGFDIFTEALKLEKMYRNMKCY